VDSEGAPLAQDFWDPWFRVSIDLDEEAPGHGDAFDSHADCFQYQRRYRSPPLLLHLWNRSNGYFRRPKQTTWN